MGISHEPPVIRPRSRPGFVLPAAIFGIVVVSLITASVWGITSLDNTATKNRIEAANALRIVQSAQTHALSLLRTQLKSESFNRLLLGYDNTPATADDGLLINYSGLNSAIDIPAAGRTAPGGTYWVKLIDDPADGDLLPFNDTNRRLIVNCRAVTTGGSSAEINVVVANFSLPGLAVDGDLEISGKLAMTGACGGMHANGDIFGGGEPTVTTIATATGTVAVNVTPKLSGAPYLDIPDLNPADFCGSAAYVYIQGGSPNFSGSSGTGTWKPTSSNLQSGKVYCVNGNVEFDEDFGSSSTYRKVSVVANGSIKNPKKTFMEAAHPDGFVMMAGGDIDIQGDSGFRGIIYGRGQCYVSSKPTIAGQFICKNKSPHAGQNWVPANLISGDASITFDCNSYLTQSWRVVSWYPTVGT